jgi:mono/diheme cytochrome c family protein
MRRIVLLGLLLLSLGLLAAGCGGEEEGTTAPETVEGTLEEETTTEQPSVEGNAEAGMAVFASAGCGGCHVLADANSSGSVGPNLDEAKPDAALVVDRVTNGQGAMPSFKDQLSEKQIADVAAYVSSVAGS